MRGKAKIISIDMIKSCNKYSVKEILTENNNLKTLTHISFSVINRLINLSFKMHKNKEPLLALSTFRKTHDLELPVCTLTLFSVTRVQSTCIC